MLDFFEAIFGNHNGMVPIGRMSIYDGDIRKLNKTDWFEWPAQKHDIVAYCEAHADEDVYFSPQLYANKKRTKEHVLVAPVLWADADTAHPDRFKITPSIVVESSPNKYQLYWFVHEDCEPQWMESASKRIAYAHRSDGCDTGWALTKYLRVPSTTNTKYDEDFTVTYKMTGTVTDIREIRSLYGDPEELTETESQRRFPDNIPTREEAIEATRTMMTPRLAELITQTPLKDWSTALWTLECSLARANVERKTAFVICKYAACNKYSRDGRSDSDLWDELCRAYEEVETERLEVIVPEVTAARVVTGTSAKKITLLTDAERTEVLHDTIIDRYVDWAKSKTRADVNYHVLSAQCLLSTIYSDYGHAIPQFGKLKLNLWFMLLGQTTKTFKTTARKLMLSVLKKLEDDEYQYDLGSDATTEGLLEDLATRPDRSGIFYRDEAQSLIADAVGGKSYLSGLHVTFTELYDGTVRGRTRASGKKTKSVGTSLVMYLMGVPNEMSSALTVDDFKSGFLARMLFYIGQPAERDRLRQANEDSDSLVDDGFDNLVDELMLSRRYWETETNPGETMAIVCKPDAWERFNDLLEDLEHAADGDEIMMAAAHRMGMSTLKLACLLAMHERKDRVDMAHMITSIMYCELWFAGLQQMSGMVATTQWEAQMNAIVTELEAMGKMTYAALYRKFKADYKPQQFRELVTALVDTGEIHQTIDSKHMRYFEARL